MTRTIALALALATLALLPAVASAAAGDPDPSFDADGKRMLPQPYTAHAVLAQPDGKIVVVGNGGPDNDFVITRLLADSWHNYRQLRRRRHRVRRLRRPGAGQRCGAAAGRRDRGRRRTHDRGEDRPGSLRLLTTGKPDTTFGPSGDGKAVIDKPTAPYRAADVLVRPDGRIVISGHGYSQDTYDMAVVQLTSLGAPDATTWDV